jgi:5-oxopent-3-ene-1,2,5-tricarboxylate decarboxylase/2-hydroxyhepta-2,4-diene-1,7-dioate isomerase
MVPRGALRPDALVLRACVNRVLGAEHTTADLMRPVARLIAQITDFMTLEPGDVLLVGVPENMPRARAGDQMTVEIDGVGRVTNTLRAAGAAS